MADIGIPYVIMGRGAWQKAADPEALKTFIFKMGTFTLLTCSLIISAAFVLFGLSLSFYLLFDRLSGYNKPEEQKWLIGIIVMVPVYTITSPTFAIYFNIIGNCYEAFALYSFGRYLIACLGEELAVQKLAKQGYVGAQTQLLDKETDNPQVVHSLPLRWFVEPWTPGRSFYDTTKFGIVQYMIIKVGCSWAALILSIFDMYGEGDFDFTMGSIYHARTLGNNISLVSIWFLCFKAVVFVTWWQGVVIALLFATGITKKGSPFHPMEEQADMLQRNLQDFIRGTEEVIKSRRLSKSRFKSIESRNLLEDIVDSPVEGKDQRTVVKPTNFSEKDHSRTHFTLRASSHAHRKIRESPLSSDAIFHQSHPNVESALNPQKRRRKKTLKFEKKHVKDCRRGCSRRHSSASEKPVRELDCSRQMNRLS